MHDNRGIFYCSPNIPLITLTDLVNNIEIGIQSKGYEEFTGDNLIINIGVIGRCTNTSTTKYKVEINIKAITNC